MDMAMSMRYNSQEDVDAAIKARVLNVSCPICNAAIKAQCTIQRFNAAGLQTQFTFAFHVERVEKAQTLAEKALDMCHRIQVYLNQYPMTKV